MFQNIDNYTWPIRPALIGSCIDGTLKDNEGLGTILPVDVTLGAGGVGTTEYIWRKRLAKAGVWADTSDNSSQPPFNEWIGFTSCIDVEEEGTYCILIGADNYVRFSLNGEEVVALDRDSESPTCTYPDTFPPSIYFKFMWVFPITLSIFVL